MVRYTYYLKTSRDREQIKRLIRDLPSYLSGRREDLFGLGRAYQLHFAASMFDQIHRAFMQKSAGRTDDLGEKWKALAPSTVEQKLAKIRRHGPKLRKSQKAKLTPTQRRIYEQVYAANFAKLKKAKGEKSAKITARRLASKAVQHAPKKLTGLGGADRVPILIDTGALERSLRPGTLTATSYSSPSREQIVRLRSGFIEIGTSNFTAPFHMKGSARMPARRIWPAIPKMRPWTTKAGTEAVQSVVRILRGLL